MIRNYLKPAIRSILKNKIFTFIHVTGLSIGITAFAIIQLYIDYESSYDKFHTRAQRIYRVQQDRYNKGELSSQTVAINAGAGPSIAGSFPEVVAQVQVRTMVSVLQYEDASFKEEKLALAGRDFFRVFSFKLIAGVDSMVLKDPYSIVLSRSAAKRYFKDADPLGKAINFRGKFDVIVTGIYEDFPENSHMKYDMLVSMGTFYEIKSPVVTLIQEAPWRWDGFYTYLLIQDGTDIKRLEEKIPQLIETETGEWLRETSQDLKLSLQPLSSIHLHSAFPDEMEVNGDSRNIQYMQLVALFLILIAWINYISLTTAKSIERGKEVGVRKVLGSHRQQLVLQFLSEAFIFNLAAMFITVLLLFVTLPYFNDLIGRHISVFAIWGQRTWLYAVGMLIIGTLVSGFYPAWVLSSFNAVLVLKGKFQASASGRLLRKVLVIVPFSVAIILVSTLYIIYRQVSFLKSQSLGFSLEQKLVVRNSEIYDSLHSGRTESFKSEIVRIPGVQQFSYVRSVPGEAIATYSNSVRRLSADESDVNQYRFVMIDENLADVFNLKLLAGRNFRKEDEAERSVLINESASKLLGYDDPQKSIHEKIYFNDDTVIVLGVVNDFHYVSPKDPILPTFYVFNPDAGIYYIIPLETNQSQAIVSQIEKLFTSIFPNQPFGYFFLDDKYNNQYKAEVQFGKVMGVFSILLLVVTALGLFGLSIYSASIRRKEMGVRKVLGATEKNVVFLFFKEYLVLISIACIIAVPVSYYLSQQWLQGFMKHIELTVFLFLMPCLLITVFTLLTISYQAIAVASANPAKTLRQE